MNAGIFIAGTGTGVGKTLVAQLLCYQLWAKKHPVVGLKPVITGYVPGESSDSGLLLEACGMPIDERGIHAISPWRFSAALSPDMAARREATTIALSEVVKFCRAHNVYTVVESAGGLMTPLNDSATMRDWAVALGWPVVIAGGSYLGALSHMLTTLQAAQAAQLTIAAAVISESSESPVPLDETLHSLKNFCDFPLIALPRLDVGAGMWQDAPDLLSVVRMCHE